MNGHRSLRRGRASIENQIYIITFTTYQRRLIFENWRHASTVSRLMESPSVLKQSRIMVWVIMPDHVHMMVQLGGMDNLSDLVKRLKSASTRKLKSDQPVWARAFHDRAIRTEDDILPAARYIVANPLRAGLVRRVGDYPYWNSVWL